MAMQTSPDGKIDRQTMVPFHLKLFYRTGAHYRPEEFSSSGPQSLPQHLQIYTWPSCTIRELSHLLTTALPSLLPDPTIGTRLSYRLVFPDTRDTRPGPGRYLVKDLGSIVIAPENSSHGELPGGDTSAAIVTSGPMSGRLEGEPERTLQDARFVIGDYVSCAIFPPGANGEVAPAPMSARGPRDRRENGFSGGGGGGGYRGGRGGGGYGRGSSYGRLNDGGVPMGEWRRGERLPDGPGGGRGYGRHRERGW